MAGMVVLTSKACWENGMAECNIDLAAYVRDSQVCARSLESSRLDQLRSLSLQSPRQPRKGKHSRLTPADVRELLRPWGDCSTASGLCDLGRLPALSGPQFLTYQVGTMMVKLSSEALSFLMCASFARAF